MGNNVRQEMGLIGRRAKPLDIGDCVELTYDDLQTLLEERGVQKPIPLKKVAARHHALARLIASGTPPGEAGILTGYTTSRVSILMSDPSFMELQAHYANEVDAKFMGMTEKLAALGMDMVDEIAERLEDNPKDFSIDELYKGTALAADRSGHGPSQKTEINVRVGLGDRMNAAQKRLEAHRAAGIIDVTPTEVEG